MLLKGHSVVKVTEMGCCGCFGFCFARKPKRVGRSNLGLRNNCSQESLLYDEGEEEDGCSYNGGVTDTGNGDDGEYRSPVKRSEEILMYRAENGLVCREIPVKETHKVVRDEDDDGNKMVNEYVREYKIGSGSYGKVVLYRGRTDGKHYALKAFRKSHLLKLRVAPSETAMSDVLREVPSLNMEFEFTAVYVLHTIQDRAGLWPELTRLASSIHIPWVVMGDFNTILEVEDRMMGSLVHDVEIRDFTEFMQDCTMNELRSIGREFTWTNSHVCSKLDRAVVNAEWMQQLPHLDAVVMDLGCSDHSPISITLEA